jgi:replicative DNA helicase
MERRMPDGHSPLFGLSQRLPPSNLQAEMALLGALLSNNKALDRCEGLKPEHFADEAIGAVYAAIVEGVQAGRLVDAVSLKGRFDQPLLASLVASMVGILNAGEYARAIQDCAAHRQLIEIGESLVNGAFAGVPPAEVGGAAAQQIDRILAGAVHSGKSFADAVDGAVAYAEAAHRGDPNRARLETGIRSFDALWQGLRPGQLYYLMARSRTGKTPAAAQIARNVSRRLLERGSGKTPEHVHFFSLEMTAEDLATINLAAVSRWTADELQSGRIGDGLAWKELDDRRATLAELPIHIDDDGGLSIAEIRVRARAAHRSHRTRLIIIDFMENIGRGAEHARMGLPEWTPFVGYQLKELAKALSVPVIALRQLNKSRDNAEATRPTLSDLPYDGGQAADGVFVLHRPELTMGDKPPAAAGTLSAEKQAAKDAEWHNQRDAMRGVVEFGAVKRRFGPSNIWKSMRFDGPRMLLREEDEAPAGQDGGFFDAIPMAGSEADYG